MLSAKCYIRSFMSKLLLIAITSAALLLIPSFLHAQETNAQLTGTVAYRERIALPPDAVIDVQLLDTSIADVAAQTVAEALINAEGRQVPVPFTLTYDPAKIVPGDRYSVRATIRSGDGMLMFSSTQAYPVLTHGAPSKANLVLRTVGHGAKPGAAPAKALPSTPEATPGSPPAEVTTPTPNQATTIAPEPEKLTPQAETKPAQSEAVAPPPSSTESAPVAEAPAAATPDTPTPQPETKPAEAPPTSEPTNPLESKTPPTTTPPSEAKASEPEAPLPEAPSATKRAELEAAAPSDEGKAADSVPARPTLSKVDTPLADTQWKLVQLDGQNVVILLPQKPVTLAFSPEGRRIAGSAGCNSYIGTFTDDQGRLHLNPGNMTMMSCADPAGSREKKFIAMLRSANGYKINGDFLLLTSGGKTVAKFKNNQ